MGWAANLIIGLAVGYLLLSVLFYLLQDLFFFRPEILPGHFEYQFPFPFEEVHFDMEDGGYINGLYFRVPNAKGVVYYLKGNSRSVKGWGKFAKDFVGKGYDFFMVDYRGFGKSAGRRTEATLYNDAQTVYRWLSDRYPEEDIVVYGRSLGSGIAARIASWNRPRMLILDSPYFSFFYQVRQYGFWLPLKWILRYQIRTDQFLRKVSCPIFILHGTHDRLIPFRQGQLLAKQSELAILIPIKGGGHNNLPDFAAYHDQLYDLLHPSPMDEGRAEN